MPNSFPDLPPDLDWADKDLAYTKNAGLVTGNDDGTLLSRGWPDWAATLFVRLLIIIARLHHAVFARLDAISPVLSERELWLKVAPSVCYCEDATAFCVAPGVLCTDWHVVKAHAPQVSTLRAPQTHVYAEWVPEAHDALLDFALLKDPLNLPPLSLAEQAPQPGDVLYCFGAGAGQALTMVRLIVGLEELNTFPDSGTTAPRRLIVCSGGIQGGDSGGVVVNQRGEVVSPMLAAWGGQTRAGISPLDVFVGWLSANLPKS